MTRTSRPTRTATRPLPCRVRPPRLTTRNRDGLQGEQEPDDGPERAALRPGAAPRTGDHHPPLPAEPVQPRRQEHPGGGPEGAEPRLHGELPRGEDALPARVPRPPPAGPPRGRQAPLRGLLHVR